MTEQEKAELRQRIESGNRDAPEFLTQTVMVKPTHILSLLDENERLKEQNDNISSVAQDLGALNAALQKRVAEMEANTMHWHEMEKEQPTEEGIYLVLAKYGDCRTSNVIGSESGIKECISWWNFGDVTHWLRIEPPQEKEKDNV